MSKQYNSEIFCRFEKNGSTYYGKYHEGNIFQLEQAPWLGISKINNSYQISQVKILHPSEPRKIIGLVKAYKQAWGKKTEPKFVRWFLKPPSAVASDGDDIILPDSFSEIKVECELSIIIGKNIKNANEQEAELSIFGFTIGNDIMGFDESFIKTTGEITENRDPSLAAGLKISDRFAPFGPFVYTNYEWQNKAFSLKIKNSLTKKECFYKDNTSNLLYTPAKIVSDLSKVLTLNPGDLIMTGTSKSFVASDGDIVTIEIEGMGKLSNKVVVLKK